MPVSWEPSFDYKDLKNNEQEKEGENEENSRSEASILLQALKGE